MFKKLLKFFGFCTHEHTHTEGYYKVVCDDCNSYI